MTDMPRLLAETGKDEGYDGTPYEDTQHLWTFAEGRCLERKPLSGPEWKYLLDNKLITVNISRPGADYLKERDLVAIENQLAIDYRDFWPHLNDARQNALLECAYQIGVAGEEHFVQMLAAVRAGDMERAKLAGLDSLWAKETPDRAVRVLEQLASGEFAS